jgi:hypothetical protein
VYRLNSPTPLGVSDEKAAWLREELRPGETIAWAGEPALAWFTRDSVPPFALGLVFSGFSLFWIAMAATAMGSAADAGQPHAGALLFRWGFPAFGLPFLAIGVGMLAAPLRLRVRARRSVFATTNERALIIEHNLRNVREVRCIETRAIGAIVKRAKADGSGDVLFSVEHVPDSEAAGGTRTVERGFFRVRDASAAEAAVRELQPLRS